MMKNWLKRTLVGVAVTGALAGSVAAWSQGPRFHGGPPSAQDIAAHQARVLAQITKRLNLDAAQQAKLQVLATKLQAARPAPPAAPASGAGSPHARIEALIAGNTFDRAGAQAAANEHAVRAQAEFTQRINLLQSNSPAIIAAFGDFFDSLNATQQQQVREFAAHHRGPGFLPGFGPGFGPGHHGGHHGDRDGHGDHQPPAGN